ENTERQQKCERTENVDPGLGLCPQPAVNDIHPHMAVDAEHISRAEHENDIEGIYLDFKIHVGAELHADVLAQITHNDVIGAHQYHDQCHPPHAFADKRTERVDKTRNAEQYLHCFSLGPVNASWHGRDETHGRRSKRHMVADAARTTEMAATAAPYADCRGARPAVSAGPRATRGNA